MSNVIESFFVSLGFEVNTEKIEEFKKKADELRESVLKVGAIATGAAVGIGLLVEKVAGSMGELYSFAELNEVSARSVAALGKIAVENDSSLEGMKSTIQSVNRVIGEAALGVGRGAMTFEKLGMSAKRADGSVKNVDDILGEVADKMAGMSRQEQIALANKLGIDPQFVKVLEKGAENLAKLREEAELMNPFTENDYKLADEVDKLFIKAKGTLGVFTKMVGVALLPQVKMALKTYMEWFKESRKVSSSSIATGLKVIASAIGTLWDWVMRVVDGLKVAFQWFTQFKALTWAAGAAIAALIAYQAGVFFTNLGAAIFTAARALMTFNASAALPVILIGGIVVAIALLVDELVNFYEGNESIIGQLNEEYPGAIYGAWGLLALLGGGFVALKWKAISSMLETMAIMGLYALDYVKLAGKAAISFATLTWGWISSAAAALASGAQMALAWIIGMGPIAWVIAAVVAAVGLIWYYWDDLSKWLGTAWDETMNWLSSAWGTFASYLGDSWGSIIAFIRPAIDNIADMWGGLTDLLTGNFEGATEHLKSIWERFVNFWLSGWEKLKAGIAWVAEKLGLSDATVNVQSTDEPGLAGQPGQPGLPGQPGKAGQPGLAGQPGQPAPVLTALKQAPALQAWQDKQPVAAQSAPAWQQPGGVIGRAGNTLTNNSTTTQTTTITAPITVNSPDPAKAGEAVKTELDRLNKQAVRNGQTAVAL